MEKLLIITLLAWSMAGCSPTSEPIAFGMDACHFCKMGIVDKQFGAEAVTKKGRVYKYDALECLINDLCENTELEKQNIFILMAVNYDDPGKLIELNRSFVLKSKSIPSPMGMNLSVYKSEDLAVQRQEISGGIVYRALDVIDEIHYKDKCVW